MSTKKALTMRQIASRICSRDDNLYSEKIVYEILKKCMDECKKGLLRGERVQLTGIGTLIPEVKTHKHYFNPRTCDNVDEYLPYTKVRVWRSRTLINDMNQTLLKNIQNGILGLEELPFEKQQITNLKDCGLISDEESEYEKNEEYEEE